MTIDFQRYGFSLGFRNGAFLMLDCPFLNSHGVIEQEGCCWFAVSGLFHLFAFSGPFLILFPDGLWAHWQLLLGLTVDTF